MRVKKYTYSRPYINTERLYGKDNFDAYVSSDTINTVAVIGREAIVFKIFEPAHITLVGGIQEVIDGELQFKPSLLIILNGSACGDIDQLISGCSCFCFI